MPTGQVASGLLERADGPLVLPDGTTTSVAALTNLMAFADADAFTVAQQMAASPECLQALVKSLARLAPPGPLAIIRMPVR